MKLWMITGSATDDGAPIYLRADGRWTRQLVEGHVVADEDERARLLEDAREQQRVVCDPYVIDVRRAADHRPAPTSLREKIRAEGPTVSLVGAPRLPHAAAASA